MRRVLALLAVVAAGPAFAQPATVRVGAHPGYGRVVFAFPAATAFQLIEDGDLVTLRFDPPDAVPDAGPTRNVLEVRGSNGMAMIAIKPGSRIRVKQVDARVVVDVLDAPRRVPAQLPAEVLRQPAPLAAVASPVPDVPPVAPAPVVMEAMPAPPAVPAVVPAAAMLAFGPDVGAAAFRRADGDTMVFDERSEIDLAPLRAMPGFASAVVQLLPAATVVTIAPSPVSPWHLERRAEGWLVAAGASPDTKPILLEDHDGRLSLPVPRPGQVVTMPDAATGENILVGTVREAGASMPASRRSPEFTIAKSLLGLVLEPHTDRIALHVTAQGFVLETPGKPLAGSAQPNAQRSLADAASLTRQFDFPSLPTATLLRRMEDEVAAAGEAPPLARFRPRLAAAQTMLALGMGAEADALLRLAATEEPRSAADPEMRGLIAIAAWLAGRPDTGGLSDPAAGTDEGALWQAIVTPAKGSAAVLAVTLPLIAAYPDPLRERVLPIAIQIMANGPAPDSADAALASWPGEPSLAHARALRLAAKGDTAAALTALDLLAVGHNRFLAAQAASEAIEMRLATGTMSELQAADALDRQFLAWRGDDRELKLRQRAAELRARSGALRTALALLRETQELYPDARPELQAQMGKLLAEGLAGPTAKDMTPLELVTIADENADIALDALSADTAGLLADRLVALDLTARADPVLDKMIRGGSPGEAQAAVGIRLAWLRAGEGNAVGALAALERTDAPGLPAALAEARALAAAQAQAQQGHPAAALAALEGLTAPEADGARVDLLAAAKDWTAAAAAMAVFVQKTVPPEGEIGAPQQQSLLRLATLQSEAGDTDALWALGVREARRMATSPQSAAFTVLTARPVREVGDLRRSASELTLAHAMPAGSPSVGKR